MMGTRSAQDKLFAADRSISIMWGATPCTGTWRRTGNTCSGMKTSPPCTVPITGGSRAPICAISILFLRAYEKVSFVEASIAPIRSALEGGAGLEMEEVADCRRARAGVEARLVIP